MLLLILPCSTISAQTSDPLEKINRITFKVNDIVDSYLIKPLAVSYQNHSPAFAKSMIGNFFSNLGEVPTVVNDVLQFKPVQASKDLCRLAVNTTLGLGGFFDVADPMLGLEKNKQDFGQTLAQWGVGTGPYIVLPLLGPSTLRDSLDVAVNAVIHPLNGVEHTAAQNALRANQLIDIRASLLPLDALMMGDRYLYMREAYMQHRDYTINPNEMMFAFEDF
jgi:phospholipid-binding lipoprotein MlaA